MDTASGLAFWQLRQLRKNIKAVALRELDWTEAVLQSSL